MNAFYGGENDSFLRRFVKRQSPLTREKFHLNFVPFSAIGIVAHCRKRRLCPTESIELKKSFAPKTIRFIYVKNANSTCTTARANKFIRFIKLTIIRFLFATLVALIFPKIVHQ